MPRKRRVKRKQQGEGPIWDWIKDKAVKGYNYVRDNRLISRGADAIAPLVPLPYQGTVSKIGKAARLAGLGEKKKRRKRKTKRKK